MPEGSCSPDLGQGVGGCPCSQAVPASPSGHPGGSWGGGGWSFGCQHWGGGWSLGCKGVLNCDAGAGDAAGLLVLPGSGAVSPVMNQTRLLLPVCPSICLSVWRGSHTPGTLPHTGAGCGCQGLAQLRGPGWDRAAGSHQDSIPRALVAVINLRMWLFRGEGWGSHRYHHPTGALRAGSSIVTAPVPLPRTGPLGLGLQQDTPRQGSGL